MSGGRGDPLTYATWTEWAYAQADHGLLTISEVNERLALELFVQNALGIAGALPPPPAGSGPLP